MASEFAEMVQGDVFDVQVEELGDTFLRVKDGLTYTAIIKRLEEMEIPVVELSEGENAADLDWRSLERLPASCTLAAGEWIVFPADGNANRQRYLVRSVHTDTTGDLALWRNAVITRSVKAQGV